MDMADFVLAAKTNSKKVTSVSKHLQSKSN